MRISNIRTKITRFLIFYSLFIILTLSGCRSITFSSVNLPPRTVILSFDDGPNAADDTTYRLLDVLKKYEVKAVFILIGERAEAYPELVTRIYKEGHLIVNHGYSDKKAKRMRSGEFLENLLRGEQAIGSAAGQEIAPKFYRPHGGHYNSGQEKILKEEGYSILPGNIRVYDATLSGTERNRKKLINAVLRKAKKQGGGIILLHDSRDSISRMEKELERNPQGSFNRSWIPDTVEELIKSLLDNGFIIGSPAILDIF